MQIDHYPEHVQDVIDAVFTKGVESSAELRHAVFAYATAAGCTTEPTAAVPAEWQPYLDKVIHHAYRITDRETADLQRQGHSEEAIVELTVLAALGAGVARLEQGLAALQKVKGALSCV